VIMQPALSCDQQADPSRVRLFGVVMDALRMPAAVSRIQAWVARPGARCRYVVTPNVDHTVLLRDNVRLQAAYQDADLVLADGWPVVVASRLVGRALPERVAGSDLVPRLFAAAHDELRVFLLGAAPGVAQRAAENIHRKWDQVSVVGTYSPPLGFENDQQENQRILQRISQAGPDVLVIGLGAPKQELWVHTHRERIEAKAALCVGATIDFLAGERKRAPVIFQRLGLEWLHRMLSDPRRLVKRYARDAYIFPQLVWQEWQSVRSQRVSAASDQADYTGHP